MMSEKYTGALYESYNYENSAKEIDRDQSFYLENQHDQSHYAYMSWRMREGKEAVKYQEQGEGYFVSAIILLEQCLAENRDRKGDAVIFPVLFNAEQGVELYIKAFFKLLGEHGILYQGRLRTHDIKTLFANWMTLLSQSDAAVRQIAEKDIETIRSFITHLFEKTEDVTFARFPYDTHDVKHFYVDANSNIIVDMNILIKWIKACFYILDRNFILLEKHFETIGDA